MAVKELPVIRERGVCCALPEVEPSWALDRAELMKALGDPSRLTMMAALWRSDSPICICDFTAALGVTQPTISHHMSRLKEAGLVDSEKRGIWVYYRLRDKLPTGTRELLSRLLS
ncbi:MAG TPA: metalloregulator ArsR/SmtB family transcription factor [Candidatus Dormibacteraeota bacterium]|nr:metalloregulator ArsR/SmtB family transcription factor [Candidatus Dormibacteraeota bacterium]